MSSLETCVRRLIVKLKPTLNSESEPRSAAEATKLTERSRHLLVVTPQCADLESQSHRCSMLNNSHHRHHRRRPQQQQQHHNRNALEN